MALFGRLGIRPEAAHVEHSPEEEAGVLNDAVIDAGRAALYYDAAGH